MDDDEIMDYLIAYDIVRQAEQAPREPSVRPAVKPNMACQIGTLIGAVGFMIPVMFGWQTGINILTALAVFGGVSSVVWMVGRAFYRAPILLWLAIPALVLLALLF